MLKIKSVFIALGSDSLKKFFIFEKLDGSTMRPSQTNQSKMKNVMLLIVMNLIL